MHWLSVNVQASAPEMTPTGALPLASNVFPRTATIPLGRNTMIDGTPPPIVAVTPLIVANSSGSRRVRSFTSADASRNGDAARGTGAAARGAGSAATATAPTPAADGGAGWVLAGAAALTAVATAPERTSVPTEVLVPGSWPINRATKGRAVESSGLACGG